MPTSCLYTLFVCRGSLTEQTLSWASGLQVEQVALLSNAKDNGFRGVTMYCDDEASTSGAALNVRASELATCCGKPLEVPIPWTWRLEGIMTDIVWSFIRISLMQVGRTRCQCTSLQE